MNIQDFNERNWNRLLDEIDSGLIIPIIGPELLEVTISGQTVMLHTWLTEQLSARLNLNYESNIQLGDIVYLFKNQNPYGDISSVYYELFSILSKTQITTPEPLKKLASITSFNFFISTTFDDFLLKAINEERFEGLNKTKSLIFSKKGEIEDISLEINYPVVYHVFGKVNTLPTYVLTDDDLLEFNYYWHDQARRPPRLHAFLRDKYHLLLGCSFENWLTRFFLCGLKAETFFDSPQSRRGIIVDNRSKEDEELILFLSRCNNVTYPSGGAIDFINQLVDKWHEKNKYITGKNQYTSITGTNDIECISESIFISYASEDQDFAVKLQKILEKEGLDVWLDKNKLESGNKYESIILQKIKNSLLFIPIISKNINTKERRFFKFEWNHAIKEMEFRFNNHTFIMPVCIDITPTNDYLIPEDFLNLHLARVLDNQAIHDFGQLVKKTIRDLRRNK